MISKGSLVRYTGIDKRVINGKLYLVKEVKDKKVTIYDGSRMHSNGKYATITLPLNDFKEVC